MPIAFQFHVYYLFYLLIPAFFIMLWRLEKEDEGGLGAAFGTMFTLLFWIIGMLVYTVLVFILQHFYPQ